MRSIFSLLRIIKEPLIKEPMFKPQIYSEILYRIKDKKLSFYDIERVYKYILKKKYSNNTVIDALDDKDILRIEEIEGYKRMLEEEEYISKLISQKYKKDTSISNWKMNLHLLKGDYLKLKKDISIDMSLVNSYIEGYSLIENIKNRFNKSSKKRVKSFSNFSPEKAIEYAITYAFNYNTEKYPSYAGNGGDCANFISQALHAGGKPMVGTNATSFNNWFCRSNHLWDVSKVSSTWRGADAFGHFWMTKAVSYKNFDSSHFKDDSKFKKVLSYANRGDAVSILNSNGRPFHTLIIIDYGRDDLICATHSRDTITASLRNYGYLSGVRIYKMSDE